MVIFKPSNDRTDDPPKVGRWSRLAHHFKGHLPSGNTNIAMAGSHAFLLKKWGPIPAIARA